jgi:hypothetical protein
MAHVGVGSLDSNLAGFGGQSVLLRPQLDVELRIGTLGSALVTSLEAAHLNPVIEFDFATGVDADMLECFSGEIVRLPTRLQRMEYSRFVYSPRCIGAQ